jgi:hypothetical protein
MAKKPDRSIKGTALRLQAEKLVRVTDRDVAAMPVEDMQRLVQELLVELSLDQSPQAPLGNIRPQPLSGSSPVL